MMKREEFEEMQKQCYDLERKLGEIRKMIKQEQDRIAEIEKKKKTLEHFRSTKDEILRINIVTEDGGCRTKGAYYFTPSVEHQEAIKILKEAIEKALCSIIKEE